MKTLTLINLQTCRTLKTVEVPSCWTVGDIIDLEDGSSWMIRKLITTPKEVLCYVWRFNGKLNRVLVRPTATS